MIAGPATARVFKIINWDLDGNIDNGIVYVAVKVAAWHTRNSFREKSLQRIALGGQSGD